MGVIKLYRTDSGWIADFVGDVAILELFGTTAIPTAYTNQASADDVIAAIQAKNPDHLVLLG